MDAEEGASAAHAVTAGDNTNGIIPLYLLKNDTPQLHTRTIQYTKVPTIPHSQSPNSGDILLLCTTSAARGHNYKTS